MRTNRPKTAGGHGLVRQTTKLKGRLGGVAWFVILSVPAAVAAYYRIFSGFMEWDDEGTVMMAVKQYLSGSKLYEEIFSGYGPVYFFYNWLVRAATGSLLNHDNVRIASAAMSVVVPLICAWLVFRLTKSLAAATVAHLVVFRGLLFFTNEPGHPQELCILLLICLAGSGVLAATPRYVVPALIAAGSLAAALTLVKVNIGIFAILAIAVAVLFQSPDSWFWRLLKYAACGAALILPFTLMRIHLGDPPSQAYCFVVTISMAGILVVAPGYVRADILTVRQCLAAATGFAVTFVLALFLGLQGAPLEATYNALISNQLKMNVSPGFWYGAVDLGRIWMAWAMAGLGAAVVVARAARNRQPWVDRLLAPLQLSFGAIGLLIALLAPVLLLGFVTPFCWLLLCSNQDQGPLRQMHARILLCTLSVLQTLTAFPMAGSQTYFLRILLMLVAAVAWVDGVQSLSWQAGFGPVIRRFARPAAAITLAGVALAYPLVAYRARRLYTSLAPLSLPGAQRIHAEKPVVEDYQWLVPNLRQNCDTFVGLPGLPSLYFWTGKPLPGPVHTPPGPLNMDQWMDLFTPAQQLTIVADFSRHPNACAIYHPSGVDFWNTGNHAIQTWPLADYILTHFKTIGQTGDYRFMIRNERQLDIPAGVSRPPVPRRMR